MPELPEVETIKNQLSSLIINKEIVGVIFNYDNVLKNVPKQHFIEELIGKKFIKIDRVAKYLLFETEEDIVISHLRMEGKWNFYQENELNNRHFKSLLLSFRFKTGQELSFFDFRKFATIEIIKKDKLEEYFISKNVGPEPWNANPEHFYHQITHSKRPIKTLLLDQKYISGVGNIYADEILFSAKINPLKLGAQLTKNQTDEILKEASRILKDSIKNGGSSIHSYTSLNGQVGNYQKLLKVHTRENQLCFDDKHYVKKIKVNGRGTYFCEGIQN